MFYPEARNAIQKGFADRVLLSFFAKRLERVIKPWVNQSVDLFQLPKTRATRLRNAALRAAIKQARLPRWQKTIRRRLKAYVKRRMGERDVPRTEVAEIIEEGARRYLRGWVRVVARNEVHQATQVATLEILKALQIKRKQWITKDDSRVRHSHRRLHKQVRPLKQPFQIPGTTRRAQRPHGFAQASENVGCRCKVIPFGQGPQVQKFYRDLDRRLPRWERSVEGAIGSGVQLAVDRTIQFLPAGAPTPGASGASSDVPEPASVEGTLPGRTYTSTGKDPRSLEQRGITVSRINKSSEPEILKRASDRDIADLLGAPDGSTISVRLSGEEIVLTGRNRDFGWEAQRRVRFDARKKPYLEHEFQSLRLAGQGQGLGTKIFSQQARTARRLGFDRITTKATRSSNLNGYYTWPRLGFDAPLSPKAKKQFGLSRLSELMATEEGRSTWKSEGKTVRVSFDLKRGSKSFKILDAYEAEKFGTPKPKPKPDPKKKTKKKPTKKPEPTPAPTATITVQPGTKILVKDLKPGMKLAQSTGNIEIVEVKRGKVTWKVGNQQIETTGTTLLSSWKTQWGLGARDNKAIKIDKWGLAAKTRTAQQVVVMVDAKLANTELAKNPDFYISPDGRGTRLRQAQDALREWVDGGGRRLGHAWELPYMTVGPKGAQQLGIVDGRHRFAAMTKYARGKRLKTIPVAVDKKELKRFLDQTGGVVVEEIAGYPNLDGTITTTTTKKKSTKKKAVTKKKATTKKKAVAKKKTATKKKVATKKKSPTKKKVAAKKKSPTKKPSPPKKPTVPVTPPSPKRKPKSDDAHYDRDPNVPMPDYADTPDRKKFEALLANFQSRVAKDFTKEQQREFRRLLRGLLVQHDLKPSVSPRWEELYFENRPQALAVHGWEGEVRLDNNTTHFRGLVPDEYYKAFKTLVHEEVHGVNLTKEMFWGAGALIEEVTTEVSSRRITREWYGFRPTQPVYDSLRADTDWGSYQPQITKVLELIEKSVGPQKEKPNWMVLSDWLERASLEFKGRTSVNSMTRDFAYSVYVTRPDGLKLSDNFVFDLTARLGLETLW